MFYNDFSIKSLQLIIKKRNYLSIGKVNYLKINLLRMY